MENTR